MLIHFSGCLGALLANHLEPYSVEIQEMEATLPWHAFPARPRIFLHPLYNQNVPHDYDFAIVQLDKAGHRRRIIEPKFT